MICPAIQPATAPTTKKMMKPKSVIWLNLPRQDPLYQRLARQAPFQDLPSEIAGGLSFFERDPAIDDRRPDAVGLLHEPPGAARQILFDGRQSGFDLLLVEDNEVSDVAGAQQPAVRQFPRRRVVEGQHADG